MNRHNNTHELFRRHLAQTSTSPVGLEILEAKGCHLKGRDGNSYLDLISGISVSNVGHNHPKVISAIKEQVDRHLHLMVYGEYIQDVQVRLAERITSLLPESLNSVYFVNSGSEAIEGALKLARRRTGRINTISLEGAYHGSTFGSLSLIGGEPFRGAFSPGLPGNTLIRPNILDDLELIDENTSCVVAEPVMGEAGVIALNTDYLKAMESRCKEVCALLVFDEVQTGMGRTGKWFALEHSEVVPDILCLAKALGGGMPLGAFIADRDVMSELAHNPMLGHITTFGGHPVSCAASLAAIEVIMEETLCENAIKISDVFYKGLKDARHVVEMRRAGLLMAMELGDSGLVLRVINRLREKGILSDWFLFRETAVRLAPPLVMSQAEADQAIGTIRAVLENI